MADGSLLTFEVPGSRGGPERPLSDDDLIGKFVDNCGDLIDKPKMLADDVLGLAAEARIDKILVQTQVNLQ